MLPFVSQRQCLRADSTINSLCCLLLDIAFPKRTYLGWYCLTYEDAIVGLPVHRRHDPCVYAIANVVFQWTTFFPDVYMPCQMGAGLGWCYLTLTDIACQNIHALADVPPMSTSMSPSKFTHSIDNVIISGMMLHAVVRCRFPNVHKQHQMHEELV